MKIINSIYLFSAVMLLGQLCSASAAVNPPSVESFFSEADMQIVALSPMSEHVAALVKVDGHQVLVVRETDDLTQFKVVAAASDNKILSVHWVNEERLVFVLKNTHLQYVDGNYDLYAVNRDGSGLLELISGSWGHTQANTGSNVKDRTLTPEYMFHGVTDDGTDDIIVAKYIFNNIDLSSHFTHLQRLNTKTKKLSELINGPTPSNTFEWLLDRNNIPRIALSEKDGKCTTSYFSKDEQLWSEIGKAGCTGVQDLDPVFFEDDNTMIVANNYQGASALFQYDLKNKKIASEPIVSMKGFDVGRHPVVDPPTGKLLGFRYDGDARGTVWLDENLKNLQAKVDGILKSTNNGIYCGSNCSHPKAVLIESASDRQPWEFFIYTPDNGKMVGLGSMHDQIKPAQMGLRDFYHYQARDGRSIPVYVTTPPGKPTQPMPTIVLVHGGPNVRGSSWEWNAEAQFLATRGYLVIQPEFRGSAGFGFEFMTAGWKQWGLKMQDDLADAANWAVQKGWADPKRIGIMGGSYGGYATLMGLIKNPELFRCGVEFAGVTDIKMMFTSAVSDATTSSVQYGMPVVYGDPVTDAKMIADNSPVNHADKLTQPLLMAHGGLDRRVPISHATEFHSAVTDHNNNVEWVVYPDEGHGWDHDEDEIDFYTRVEKFFDKNLKSLTN